MLRKDTFIGEKALTEKEMKNRGWFCDKDNVWRNNYKIGSFKDSLVKSNLMRHFNRK